MDVTTIDPASSADHLRADMVAALRKRGLRSERVAAAMLAVPRHHYAPDNGLAAAYADNVVIIKTDAQERAISSASAPGVVADMLEQLDVRPGDRVLEVGAGTGWNAALLAYLAGPTGHVVTIEFDPEVAARARSAIVGLDNVQVITGDGHLGYPAAAPYDRIIVTAGAHDVDPRWVTQLAEGGRLLVPLRLPWHIVVAFENAGNGVLRSVSASTAGFIPMAGPAAPTGGDSIEVGTDPVLARVHDPDADRVALKAVLTHPPAEAWTGVVVDDGDSWEHLHLWLMAAPAVPGFCKWNITEAGTRSGLLRPLLTWGGLGFHEGPNFAYATNRRRCGPHPDANGWEVGIIGHGPQGEELAAWVAVQIRAWADRPRTTPKPWIELHPKGAQADRLRGRILDRPHHRYAIVTADQ